MKQDFSYGVNVGSSTSVQTLSDGQGGSPGRRVTLSAGSGGLTGVYSANIYTSYTFDPAVSGSLSDLSLSIDGVWDSIATYVGFAVKQGSTVWLTPRQGNAGLWSTFSYTASNNWYTITSAGPTPGVGPDFSSIGAPIQFGYLSSVDIYAGANWSARFDNFNVSFAVPAPGAAGLLGIGGLVMGRRRR